MRRIRIKPRVVSLFALLASLGAFAGSPSGLHVLFLNQIQSLRAQALQGPGAPFQQWERKKWEDAAQPGELKDNGWSVTFTQSALEFAFADGARGWIRTTVGRAEWGLQLPAGAEPAQAAWIALDGSAYPLDANSAFWSPASPATRAAVRFLLSGRPGESAVSDLATAGGIWNLSIVRMGTLPVAIAVAQRARPQGLEPQRGSLSRVEREDSAPWVMWAVVSASGCALLISLWRARRSRVQPIQPLSPAPAIVPAREIPPPVGGAIQTFAASHAQVTVIAASFTTFQGDLAAALDRRSQIYLLLQEAHRRFKSPAVFFEIQGARAQFMAGLGAPDLSPANAPLGFELSTSLLDAIRQCHVEGDAAEIAGYPPLTEVFMSVPALTDRVAEAWTLWDFQGARPHGILCVLRPRGQALPDREVLGLLRVAQQEVRA